MTKEFKIEKKLKIKRYEHKNSIASIIPSSNIDKFQETKKYIKKVMQGKKVNKILLVNPGTAFCS